MSFFRFIAGLAGGTALGLLFAKKSGKDLRKQLKGKNSKQIAEVLGKELLDAGKDMKEVAEEIAESKQVKQLVNKGKAEVAKAVSKGKAEMSKAVSQAKKAVSDVKKKAPAAKAAVKKEVKQVVKKVVAKAKKTI